MKIYSARNDYRKQAPAFTWTEMFRRTGTLYSPNWERKTVDGLRFTIDAPRTGLEREPNHVYTNPFHADNEPAMTYREIADEIGLSVEGTRLLIERALRKMRIVLKRWQREEDRNFRRLDRLYRRKMNALRG